MTPFTFTVDGDEDTGQWKVTKRDEDNMPVDEQPYPTLAAARRGAANKRYGAKTRRPALLR